MAGDQQDLSRGPRPQRLLTLRRSLLSLCRYLLTGVSFVCVGWYAAASWRWPFVGDAAIFHYVVFLLGHGMAPYRDIADVNLPGTYAFHALVIRLLGNGAHAWRLFDLGLLGVTAASMLSLTRACRLQHWAFAGSFAASTFALIHARDGLFQQGQRDLILAALLVTGYALLFEALRRPRNPYLWTLAGIAFGSASTIKPVALLLLLPLSWLVALHLRRTGQPLLQKLALLLAGVLIPLAAMLAWLLHAGALSAFVQTMQQLVPFHSSLERQPLATLLGTAVSSVCLPLAMLWLPVFLYTRRYQRFEDQALLLGFLLGVISFCLQGRGYTYHRYPSEAFLLLLAGIAFTGALEAPQTQSRVPLSIKALALAGLLFGTLVIGPRSLAELRRFDPADQFGVDLQADLTRLGGPALNHRVQCLDLAYGCLNTLDRMQLVQASGYLYDCYLYPAAEPTRFQPQEARYRQGFEQAMARNQPLLFIVTSNDCSARTDFSYRKLARYPWLNRYLAENYTLVEDHIPQGLVRWAGRPQPPTGYRIYRLRQPTPTSPWTPRPPANPPTRSTETSDRGTAPAPR